MQNLSRLCGKKCTFTFGKARFNFLTTRLVRIEWAEDGVFEERPSLQAFRPAAGGVKVSASVRGGVLTARTEHLTLTCRDTEDGFVEEGSAYEILDRGTPRPWFNALWNDQLCSWVWHTGQGESVVQDDQAPILTMK